MYILIVSFLLVVLSVFSPASALICTDGDKDGYYAEGGGCGTADCDDNNPDIHPGVIDVCDGKDTDCNAWTPWFDVDKDGDGIPRCAFDCNDSNSDIYPGAPELCDGIDNSCRWFIPFDERDNDGDGVRLCDVPADCDDNDATVSPYTQEIIGDGIDNNCDGITDVRDFTACTDYDHDGFDDIVCGGTDCNDSDVNIYPGAEEICDRRDSDCDGFIPAIEVDNDGDGFPVCSGDCDDSNEKLFPVDLGLCDDENSDCDGLVSLTWSAPFTNVDGSPLTDLAGYGLYYRTSSHNYSESIHIGNVTCYAIAKLPEGIWCFKITASDISGNESSFSNEVCIFIDQ